MIKRKDQLIAAVEKAAQKQHSAEQEKKRYLEQLKKLERNERTHRLCTRGAYLETLLQEPDVFSDEELFAFLDYAFTPFVADRLKEILKSKHPSTMKPMFRAAKRRQNPRENHRTSCVRCAPIRTVPARGALSEDPCGELAGSRRSLSPASGASPCADSIGYPITAHGAEKTR